MNPRYCVRLRGLLAITAVLVTSSAHASLEDEIKTAVAADPALPSGNAGLVIVNGNPYLVVVGASALVDRSPKSILRARRMSRLRAEEGFTRFVRGETIQTETTLQLRGTTQQTGGQPLVERSEILSDIQRAYAQGYLPPTRTIDAWPYDEHTLLYVIYMEAPPSKEIGQAP